MNKISIIQIHSKVFETDQRLWIPATGQIDDLIMPVAWRKTRFGSQTAFSNTAQSTALLLESTFLTVSILPLFGGFPALGTQGVAGGQEAPHPWGKG